MGVELSRARVRGGADRRGGAALGAEHRVPRGRPAGDHGRPGLVRRRLSDPRRASRRAASRWRAWRRTSPICRKRRCTANSAATCRTATRVTYGFDADFQVESYLRHQGSTFVDRFDANSYLYITRAMDYFDLAAEHGGSLPAAFRGTQPRFCIVSFTSDWLFPTSESRALVHALNAVAANVSFVEIETDKGHDAFLLHEPELFDDLARLSDRLRRARGLSA